MQSRRNKVDPATDLNTTVSRDICRESVVENTNVSWQSAANPHQSEALRSYRDVYKTVRFALDHPMFWILHRVRRIRVSYGLPMMWAGMGCVCGLGIAMFHQLLTPTVKLPTRQEMNAVFTLHDLNELLIASHPQIRSKS